VDTSRNFSSATFNFVIGSGHHFPAPTPEEYVHILNTVALRLDEVHLLDHVVGNRGVFTDMTGTYELSNYLATTPHPYSNKLRARRIYARCFSSTERSVGDLEDNYYLAYDGKKVMWLWLCQHTHRSDKSGVVDFAEITPDNAIMALGGPEHPVEKHFDGSILESFVEIMNDEVSERKHRLELFEKETLSLTELSERFASALLVPRRRGDGMEN
jgi:hypothetical protein